jgi:hypothetical protein
MKKSPRLKFLAEFPADLVFSPTPAGPKALLQGFPSSRRFSQVSDPSVGVSIRYCHGKKFRGEYKSVFPFSRFRIWPGLLLSRTMLAGILPVYVDRFACSWHRFSTTDLETSRKQYYIFSSNKLQ